MMVLNVVEKQRSKTRLSAHREALYTQRASLKTKGNEIISFCGMLTEMLQGKDSCWF